MVVADAHLVVFSSKRSTHHAFLEGLLADKRFVYDNNLTASKEGELVIDRTTTSDEPQDAPFVRVASFERRYRLPNIYGNPAFRQLEERGFDPDVTRRVVFLRDPLNTLASTYQVFLKSPYFSDLSYVRRNLRQWSNVARYVLDGGMQEETFIYANQFWSDETYRDQRLQEVGVATFHQSDRLSRFGGGGNTYFDKDAAITTRSLTSRWESCAGDEGFADLVREHRSLFERFSAYVGDTEIEAALRAF